MKINGKHSNLQIHGKKLDSVMLAILGSVLLHSVAEKTAMQISRRGP